MELVSVLFLILMAAVVKNEITPEQKANIEALSDACMKEIGVSEEVVTKAMAGEFSEDPKFKDHLVCIGKKGGFISADGKHVEEEIKKNLTEIFGDDAKADEVMKHCFQERATPQETAFESVKCFYNEYRNM